MEKFTAAQARELMPNRFNEMVERIHTDIREAALAGKTGITTTFRSEFNNNGGAYKVKDFLEKDEGYSVILSVMATSFSFCINWRESK
jgi:hypothetical protein